MEKTKESLGKLRAPFGHLGALFDPQGHVTHQTPFIGVGKARGGGDLPALSDVVKEKAQKEQVPVEGEDRGNGVSHGQAFEGVLQQPSHQGMVISLGSRGPGKELLHLRIGDDRLAEVAQVGIAQGVHVLPDPFHALAGFDLAAGDEGFDLLAGGLERIDPGQLELGLVVVVDELALGHDELPCPDSPFHMGDIFPEAGLEIHRRIVLSLSPESQGQKEGRSVFSLVHGLRLDESHAFFRCHG